MELLRQALFVARKDLAIEIRTKESLNAAAAFAISILLLFSFAFDPSPEMTHDIGGGLLWIVFLFSGALIFNRGFARELPNECLDALMASPLSAAALALGKAITNFALLLFIEICTLLIFGIFFNVNSWRQPGELIGVFLLATWGIAVVGSVFGALTVNLRLREVMLPVIIYPLLIPLLIAAIELTRSSLNNEPMTADQWLWMRVLLVFDLIFTALALALAETILVN